ncbi:MAG: hypothetical protein GTO12_07205 [Proteobacteria bacterium]|nr:hypothetical protein [Pseudomonadota bacterium]
MSKRTILSLFLTIISLSVIATISMAGNLFWVDLDELEGTQGLSGPHVAFVERATDTHKTKCTLYIFNAAGYGSMSQFTDTDNDGVLDVLELWAGRAFLVDRRYGCPFKPYYVVQSGVPNSVARQDYQTLLQATEQGTEDEIWQAVRDLLGRP